MSIGENIKAKRKALRMSQTELAEKTGLTQTTISALERSVNAPAASSLSLLASAFGCTVSELMGETKQAVAVQEALTHTEMMIISNFRKLNKQGKEFILQSMDMAVLRYGAGDSGLSNVANK